VAPAVGKQGVGPLPADCWLLWVLPAVLDAVVRNSRALQEGSNQSPTFMSMLMNGSVTCSSHSSCWSLLAHTLN
jgi:hypothetical protein